MTITNTLSSSSPPFPKPLLKTHFQTPLYSTTSFISLKPQTLISSTPFTRFPRLPTAIYAKNNDTADGPDRLISAICYFYPFFDGIQYGKYVINQFTFLQTLISPLVPAIRVFKSFPFNGFLVFLTLYFIVVRNNNFSRYVRFNTMQAIVLDVLLIFPDLIERTFNPKDGVGLDLLMSLDSTVFLFLLVCLIYGTSSCVIGQVPRLPIVAVLGSGDHSVDLEVKNPKNVVGEGSRPPPPPGFEEILDPEPKKERDSKVPEIIEIDDDDDDDDDDGDRDLMKVSSKRKRDEIKRDDSDDDKCISFLRRKKVSKVTQDHKKDNYDNKIPTRTSHLKSPFCDSSSSDSDNEITKMSAKISLPKDRWETREDMVKEFNKDDQLCLNAICALHKQDASQKHVVLVRPFDAFRISSLSRKKTLSELSSFDLHQCRQFAMDYSDKLFDIYKEKSDTFFPAL